jgi:hypothetical protein
VTFEPEIITNPDNPGFFYAPNNLKSGSDAKNAISAA